MKAKYPVFKTISKLIKETIRKDKVILYFCLIYTITTAIAPLFLVYLPKYIISELVNESINFDNIIKIVVIFTVLSSITSFLSLYTMHACNARITMVRITYLSDNFHKVNQLDYKYTEDPKFLDSIESAIESTSSNNNGVELCIFTVYKLFAKIITIILYILIISKLSIYVLLALLVSIIVSITISIIVKKIEYKSKDKLAHANRKLSYYANITQDFSYGKDIRLYELQDKVINSYNIEIKSYISVFKKIRNKEYLLGFLDLIFVLLSDAVIYYILITKVLNDMPIADFSMYLVAIIALSTLLKETSNDISSIVGEGQYVNDYFKFMNTEYNEKGSGLSKIENDTLEIEFKNVSFKYPNTDKWIFKDFNLKINKKEKLAIVGINGAGKTTLVKLITRLFDPTEGEIFVNGINIKEYDKQEYYKMFSVVFQDINILAYTIRENITLNKSNDELRIWDCLDRVGLGDKVRGFKKGLDTMMLKIIDEEGVIFSGGENQKLMIARALYKNGSSVILDEPTAALDALAEAEIYQNFNDLVTDKTSIYISHRLASTKFCDHIALFSESKLLEYGTHDELMNLKGEYYNMFKVQGKYYQEDVNNE